MDKRTFARFAASAVILTLALSACGGGKSTTTNGSNAMSAASAAPTTETQRETSALPLAQTAPVPSDVNCGAVKPVWVNLKSKAYHEAGDPYYGKTKNGKYMCPSDAAAQGYHAAGASHKSKKSGGTGAMASPAADSTP
jgi:hypothetical protein